MSSIARYAIVLALSWGCAGLAAAVQGQTNPKKTPTNTVSGRVTIQGKGAPGIVVGLRNFDFSVQPTPTAKATTDEDGNYRITDVPPGRYQVSPRAPAYVNPDPVDSQTGGKMLLLATGEDVQSIDFSLVRGGVIAGKVTDSGGRPLIEERLTLVTEDQARSQGQRFSVVDGTFQTDDRGMYRIYGIPEGRYKISVGVGDGDQFGNVRFGRVVYKRTFHPAATDVDEAKVIEVNEGTEATNIDITVERNLPGFVARGKVVDGETGQPVGGLSLGLRRVVNNREAASTPAGALGILTPSSSRGEFRMENVTPGKYLIYIAPEFGGEVRADAVSFEVVDQDVTGLLVKTLKGLTIIGNVTLDGVFDRNVFAKLRELRLQVYVQAEGSRSPSWQQSAIDADGSFRLGGLAPGTANFLLTGDRRPASSGFAIVRIERDGVVQQRGVELKAGESTIGVKIVVSYGTGSVRGEVKLENGPLPTGGRIVVWLRRVGDTSPNSRTFSPDVRGHFLIDGIAAGSYELTVNANIPGRRPLAEKRPIEVADGNPTQVVIALDLKPDPEQLRTP